MFTGLYPWEHGATQTNLELDVEEDLLAEKLNDEGYRTACFSANPFISKRVGTTAGFDKVETTIGPDRFDVFKSINKKLKAFENRLDFGAFPKAELLLQNISYSLNRFSGNETENLISKATDFMGNNKEDDFFLFMNLMDCHLPLFPDKEYKKKHAEDVNPGKVRQFPHRLISEGEEPDTESLKKLYRAQMDYLDDQIGNLYSFLEDEGLEEETMVVIVGDHGENLGEEGMLGHSFSVSEALVSVPLVVKSPEMEPGRREHRSN
jgi:arylsulfatase A-like enzyme